MPTYRVHRLRDYLRASFRSAPHVSGTAALKPRDYVPGGDVEAATPYAAFLEMRGAEKPLEVGDVLEAADGSLRVCKFVGFEEAHWIIAEPAPAEQVAAQVAQPTADSQSAQ